MYNTHLVDLPCITESLKTIDNKQFYKIADVSQMLIVQDPSQPVRISKDGLWPDGISPPLKNVRTARFRKRMSKKTIEDVEAEVERLLLADAESQQVRYEVHERKDGDESMFDEDDDYMAPGSEAGDGEAEDFDLDAEINEALDAEQEDEPAEESEEESDEQESDNDEPEDNASDGENEQDESNLLKKQSNVLKHEIQDLEKKVAEKNALAMNQVNPIMKVYLFNVETI